ncbi:hypothetical protein CLM82_28360 [Streptomyces albidoflavus]|nr:hypothetical protein CLM82_28360 [Streptomyces albidoflavus]
MPDQLLSDVRRLTADIALDDPDVGPDTSFFELGAESLALMGMTAELEEGYGARVAGRGSSADQAASWPGQTGSSARGGAPWLR